MFGGTEKIIHVVSCLRLFADIATPSGGLTQTYFLFTKVKLPLSNFEKD